MWNRREILEVLAYLGFYFVRPATHGDIYVSADGSCRVQVPQHTWINPLTARDILKVAWAAVAEGSASQTKIGAVKRRCKKRCS